MQELFEGRPDKELKGIGLSDQNCEPIHVLMFHVAVIGWHRLVEQENNYSCQTFQHSTKDFLS